MTEDSNSGQFKATEDWVKAPRWMWAALIVGAATTGTFTAMVKGELDSINKELRRMTDKVTQVNSRFPEFTNRLNGLENRLTRLETAVEFSNKPRRGKKNDAK